MNILAKDVSITSMTAAEWQARVDLAAVYRLVAQHGWDDVIYNHAGLQDGPGHGRTFPT
jgi:hypothetical protein